MSFPKTFLGIAIGWEKRGDTGGYYDVSLGKQMVVTHGFCGTQYKIGIEDGEVFKYCPKCKIKID